MKEPPRPSRWTYAGVALLLGLGAPAGALAVRLVLYEHVRRDVGGDFERNAFFYAYLLVGTCVVFAIAGLVAGRRAERLYAAEVFYHRLADHDALTGLFNARVFHERCRRAVERAARAQHPVGVILIDVDHLKQINDEYGHETGSRALEHVARALRVSKRASDDAARWGGDEFALLLPGGDEAASIRVSEKVLAWLRDHRVAADLAVSVTIGVAAYVPKSPDDDLFAVADAALYEGKRAGRNQVRVGKP